MNLKQSMQDLTSRVSSYPEVLCLLGLGSMAQIDRLDQYSDMDFFLIVKQESKQTFLHDLTWLSIKPIVFSFQNTVDGYKVLFSDGTFAEFAIFTENEMKTANFSKGVIYYKKEGFDESLVEPRFEPQPKKINIEFNINEALSNIYIGLKRDHRRERSSATTFIQVYAYQLIIELFPHLFEETKIHQDLYVFERRIEQRFPHHTSLLESFRQGYTRNKASASAMLNFLKEHFNLNPYMVKEIEKML